MSERSRLTEIRETEPLHRPVAGMVLAGAIAVVLGVAVIGLPRERAELPRIARQALELALPQWHTTEPVNEVVYGTRAFDTFGETFILLAAVMSVVLLTRHREQRRGYFGEEEAGREERRSDDPHTPAGRHQRAARDAEEREGSGTGPELPDDEPVRARGTERAQAMTVVVRVVARLVLPLLLVAGLYLVLLGYSPGGGFPAGIVMLGGVLLVYAAFGYRRIEPVVRPEPLEVAELLGAVAIILILTLGLVLEGSVGTNWLPLAPEQTIRSGGTAQAFSLAELVEVATGLTIAVFSVFAMRHDWTDDE